MPVKKDKNKSTTHSNVDDMGKEGEYVDLSLSADDFNVDLPSLDNIISNGKVETPVIEEQKQIAIMSWTLTKMRYNFTLMEKNLFLKVIEVGQKFINKENLGKNYDLEMIKTSLGDVPRIEFPIKDVLQKGKNYQWVKDSLRTLNAKTFGIPAEDQWDFKDVNLFQSIEASEKKGLMRVELTHYFWDAFFKLKVFKMIDTNVAYKFKSVYTERLYELLVGNKVAVTYDLINLRKMFALENKYKNNNLFITNVVVSSQTEMKNLDVCPFYFDYKLVYDGRRIDKITFHVIDKKNNLRQEVITSIKEDGNGVELDERVMTCIKRNFPRYVIHEEGEQQLKHLQKTMGVNDLVSTIEKIWATANKQKEEGNIRLSMSAYFGGALKKLYSESAQAKETVKQKKSNLSKVAQDTEDGYVYYSREEIEEKAKILELPFDQVIVDLCIEEVGEGRYRSKIR